LRDRIQVAIFAHSSLSDLTSKTQIVGSWYRTGVFVRGVTPPPAPSRNGEGSKIIPFR
jgi:hypothetical protein